MTRCPELAKLFGLFYKNDSKVWLREENENWRAFATEEGCVQGCVMGPLVFGFATIALYEKVQNELKNKENSLFKAYSDDSFIGASHDNAVAAFKVFKEEAETRNNLKINFGPNKTCVLLGRCDTQEETQQRVRQYLSLGFPAENIKVHPDNEGEANEFGYIHLGIPVGSKEFCTVKLDQLIEKFTSVCECDEEVESTQQKWVYLLWVVRQKFPFWFRHMCPSITKTKAPAIIGIMRNKFQDLADFDIDDKMWRQICLPIKSHGFGLGDPMNTITAAFVAHVEETLTVTKSILKTPSYLDLLDINAAIPPHHTFNSDDIENWVMHYRSSKKSILEKCESLGEIFDDEKAAVSVTKKKSQHFYFTLLTRASVKEFEEDIVLHGTLHDKARTLSNDGSLAGAWLHNIPKKDELHMNNHDFRVAVQLRLGKPFRDRPTRCKCTKKPSIDAHCDHIMCCKLFNEDIKARHDALCKNFQSLTNHAGLTFIRPKLGELRTPHHDDSLAADGCVKGLFDKATHIDVTIANPTGQTYLRMGAHSQRHLAIKTRGKYKEDKYKNRCQQIDRKFMPLAFEIYGSCSEKVDSLIKSLVHRAASLNNIPYSVLLSYWRRRIATTLQVYNARIINQACVTLNDYGGGNKFRDFGTDRVGY
jgi:hypothetical protein